MLPLHTQHPAHTSYFKPRLATAYTVCACFYGTSRDQGLGDCVTTCEARGIIGDGVYCLAFMTPLRLGSQAPDFTADTSNGEIRFHEYISGTWAVLFSHPDDFTPVCTTELGEFAKLEPEFTKRNVKLIGLSANDVHSHKHWIADINEVCGCNLQFPIIADPERKVALAYDMIDHQDSRNVDSKGMALTIRSVVVIDPTKTVRLILSYPASTGRNTAEILRTIDSMQRTDRNRITTPVNWTVGDDVIIAPYVTEHEADVLFKEYKTVTPYLRFTKDPEAGRV